MSFEGFFRLIWGGLVGCGVAIILVWLSFHFYFKWYNPNNIKEIKLVRTIITLVIVVGLGVWVFTIASLNLFPRATIDRSSIDQQNQQWEQKHINP